MISIVLAINIGVSILCWYLVLKILKIRRALTTAVRGLEIADRSTHNVLYRAPEAIARGQVGIYQLRQRYQRLELQLQKLQTILSILSWLQVAWVRVSPKRRQRRSRWARKSMMVSK
jgi:hypothetical protein